MKEWHPESKLLKRHEIEHYVASLGDGWRAPTRAELIDAYDTGVEGFEKGFYWSSTTYAYNTDYAWCVDFNDGYDYWRNNNKYYVRAIREVV